MMIKSLMAYDITPRILDIMYQITRIKSVTPDGDTKRFVIKVGVLQGDTLA